MPLLRQGPGGDSSSPGPESPSPGADSPGPGADSPGPGPDELGATDELIAFKDEGEEEKRSSAERRDLDDVKSSLVNETETGDHRPEPKAERRLGEAGGPGAEPEDRAYQQALRARQDAGLFQTPLVGYPFFMIPDLASICSPYIANGALTASRRTFLPFQWPLLDLPGPSAIRETPATQLSSVARPDTYTPQRASHGFSPAAGVPRTPQATGHTPSPGGVSHVAHPLSWLLMSGSFSPRLLTPARPPPPPATTAAAAGAIRIKQEPGCSQTDRKSPVTEEEKKKKKPHIKKPLNAFMLYMRDERASVVRECSVKESATINQILGQRWHSLSKDDQAKYYELAREERLVHSKLYPGWSARDNYGRKKKRKRSPTDVPPPVQEFPLELKKPRPPAGEAPLAALARPPPTRPPSASHLTHTHLSQASPASSLDSPATPTSALASPAAPAPTHTEHLNSSPCACTSPSGEQLQPLSLTTKPPRTLHPLRGPASSGTLPSPQPPPATPIPPPTSTHQSAVSCHGALTPPLFLRAANQQ